MKEATKKAPGFRLADLINDYDQLEKFKAIMGNKRIINDPAATNPVGETTHEFDGEDSEESQIPPRRYEKYDANSFLTESILTMYRRPRIKLGYHASYKIDVYCYFIEGDGWWKLRWETEDMNRPRGSLTTKEKPLLACCFAELDPIHAPFDQMLAGINLTLARSNTRVRKEISDKLKEWYLKQDELPIDNWRGLQGGRGYGFKSKVTSRRTSTSTQSFSPAAANSGDMAAAWVLIRDWQDGGADYIGMTEKSAAEQLVTAYQAVGKVAPTVSLVRLTASKISQSFDDMSPSGVVEWREWEKGSSGERDVETNGEM